MVNAWVSTGEVLEEDATIVWHASPVGEGRGLDLEDVVRQLPGGDASLGGEWMRDVEYCRKAEHTAVVRTLQSQLHKVSNRRASGDRTILPRLSAASDFGMNTLLLAVKFVGELLSREMLPIRSEQLGSPSGGIADSFCGQHSIEVFIVQGPL